MKNNGLFDLFLEELEDMYSAEKQIIEGLPGMIDHASLEELKEALSAHLTETKNQLVRIEEIFSILGSERKPIECKAMQGLISEAKEMVGSRKPSATLDAAIIAAAQKIEHYEIASYGTLKSFAKHLSLEKSITDLIQENLDEEGGANKKLTKIADGTFFSSGVNKEAAQSH
jgi:ferritin-like metal-binding protein YciE